LIETLNVVLQIVAPRELPMEDLEDMQNFPQMPETDKRFWQMFEEQQFSETFGMFPEEWLDDFWLKTLIRNSSSSFSSDDDEPETEEERAVHILNHPHVIPFLELRKNIIVAICPNEQWFLDRILMNQEKFLVGKNFITPLFSKRYPTTTLISGTMVCQ
jgi:hypothetical protein